MATNDNLLVPAAQKLYSALSSLERFSKHNDFFDNISSLDYKYYDCYYYKY